MAQKCSAALDWETPGSLPRAKSPTPDSLKYFWIACELMTPRVFLDTDFVGSLLDICSSCADVGLCCGLRDFLEQSPLARRSALPVVESSEERIGVFVAQEVCRFT